MTDEQKQKALELYGYGMNDAQVAKRVGVGRCAINTWRLRSGLPTIAKRIYMSRAEHTERLRLYRLGYSDHRIAKARGITQGPIAAWREKNGLKPKHVFQETPKDKVLIGDAAEDRRMALYRRGRTDDEIARVVGVTRPAIWDWRKRRGLESNRQWERGPTSTVSMDADLGDGGFNRHTFIADAAASEWLEENGATRW